MSHLENVYMYKENACFKQEKSKVYYASTSNIAVICESRQVEF